MSPYKRILSLLKGKKEDRFLEYMNKWFKSKKVEPPLKEKKNEEAILEENLNCPQTFIDTIPNPIYFKDKNGVYQNCNAAFSEYLGFTKEEIIGHTVYDLSPKDLADIYHKADMDLIQSKGKQIYEAKVQYRDGSFHDALFTKAVIINEAGFVKGIVGNMIDITERKRIEKKINRLLKLQEAMLDINKSIIEVTDINNLFNLVLEKVIAAMENAEVGCVLILDMEDNFRVAASKGYDTGKTQEFTIQLKDSFFGRMCQGNLEKSIIINDIAKLESKEFPEVLESAQGFKVQSSISTPIVLDGRLYGLINVESKHNNVFDEMDLEILEYLRNQIEVAISRHKLYEETIYLSRYDKLTNVYNRRYFEEVVSTCFAKAIKYNENFLIVIFDLNELKHINDTYGHLAGDELIKVFASRLSSKIRTSDILARFGGDEFVAVFFGINVQSLIEKLEDLLVEFKNNPIQFEENNIICSFSYGIASFSKDGENYNELIKIADKNMYEYKQKIKNNLNKTTDI